MVACRGSAPPSARRSTSRWGCRATSGRRRSGRGSAARGGAPRGRAPRPSERLETGISAPPDHRAWRAGRDREAPSRTARRETRRRRAAPDRSAGMVLSRRSSSRTMQRCVPEIVQSRRPDRAERAAVADAVRQDPPGERQLVAVLPGDARHLAVVVRLGAGRSRTGRGKRAGDRPRGYCNERLGVSARRAARATIRVRGRTSADVPPSCGATRP